MICPVCEREESFDLVEEIGIYKIMLCPECGLQFSEPMIANNPDMYDKMYINKDLTKSKGFSGFAWQLERWKDGIPKGYSKFVLKSYEKYALKILQQRLQKGAPVLDIGCGSGRFLAALRDAGFQPLGLDIAGEPIKVLSNLGFTVAQNTITNYPKTWPKPEAITAFEVLEHLPNPVEFLHTISTSFPSALLQISVPSPTRWQLWRGRREPEDYPPNHLTRWNEKSLRYALSKAGYKKISVIFFKVKATNITGTGIGRFFSQILIQSKRESKNNKYKGTTSKKCLISIKPVIHERLWGFVKRIVYFPIVIYLNKKGFSGPSMLAISEF